MIDRVDRECLRDIVGGIGLGQTAKEIARELVEDDHGRNVSLGTQ